MSDTPELTDMSSVEADLVKHMRTIRRGTLTNRKLDHSLCALETFVAIALRVMKHSKPEDVRDAARIVEIKARLDGVPVIREAA